MGAAQDRKNGYYRVKYQGIWEFAKWNFFAWEVVVSNWALKDSDLEYIDETIISPIPERKWDSSTISEAGHRDAVRISRKFEDPPRGRPL